MRRLLSNLLLHTLLIAFTNTLCATSTTIININNVFDTSEVLKKKPKAKKIKIELNNGMKIKGFIIKVDEEFAYFVLKRKMVQNALDDNCQNCDKILLSSINKVQKTSKFLLILASVLLVLGFGLITIAVAGLRDTDRSTAVPTIYLILAAIPISFLIGWGVGALFKKKYKAEETNQFLHEHSAEYLNN